MDEYVSKKDVIGIFEKHYPHATINEATVMYRMKEDIKRLHSGKDVIPVIRCRDCKFFDALPNRPDEKGICRIRSTYDEEPRYNTSAGFCNYGRRNER